MAEIDTPDFSTSRLTERQALKRTEDFIGELLLALSIMSDNASLIMEQWCNSSMAATIRRDMTTDDNEEKGDEEAIILAGFEKLRKDIQRYQLQLRTLQHKIQNTANLVSPNMTL